MDKVKYVGIDSFNRPIFKSLEKKAFYGSTNKLFSYGATEQEVLEKVDENDLCYFGNSFGCEPWGTPAENLSIVRS